MRRFALHVLNLACVAGLASACAQNASQIAPAYVSRDTYSGASCAALVRERNEIVRHVNYLVPQQNAQADADAALVGIGVLLFWPALLAVPAGPDHSHQIAQLKGQYDAINYAGVRKNCWTGAAPTPLVTRVRPEPTKVESKDVNKEGGMSF